MNQGVYLNDANIANLQSDEITRLMHSLVQSTLQLNETTNFICPHTVLLMDNYLQYNESDCRLCSLASNSPNKLMKNYQLSGILYFLLGGQENDQSFYQTVDQYYFFDQLQLRMNLNRFQAEFRILNYQSFEQKYNFYQFLLNSDFREYCPHVAIFQLKRYYLVIDKNHSTIFAKLFEDPEIVFFESYKELMKMQVQVEQNTPYRFPFPCIHSLYIKRIKENFSMYYLAYNIFYSDNLCDCKKFHGRTLFFLLTHNLCFTERYQDLNIVQNQFIDFAVRLADKNLTPLVFWQEMESFQDNMKLFKSYIMGENFQISFYANGLFRQIKGLVGNQLCCAYKIVFLQQTIELKESLIVRLRQLHPQFNDSTIYNNIIYLKKIQVQRIINYYENYQGDEIFVNLLEQYNGQIEDAGIIEAIDDITLNPVLTENGIENQLYSFRIFVSQDLDVRLNFDAPNNVIRQQLNIVGEITYNDLVRFERQITQNPPNI